MPRAERLGRQVLKVRTTVTVEPDGLTPLRERLANQSSVLNIVGMILRREFAENFARQGRPGQWQPLSPSVLADKRRMMDQGSIRGRVAATQTLQRGGGGTLPGILVRTGDLRNAYARRNVRGNIHELSGDGRSLTVGVNLPYAAYHEEGTQGDKIIKPRKPGGVLCWYGIDPKTGREGWQFAKYVKMKPLARRQVLYISPEGVEAIGKVYEAYLEGRDPKEAVGASGDQS